MLMLQVLLKSKGINCLWSMSQLTQYHSIQSSLCEGQLPVPGGHIFQYLPYLCMDAHL